MDSYEAKPFFNELVWRKMAGINFTLMNGPYTPVFHNEIRMPLLKELQEYEIRLASLNSLQESMGNVKELEPAEETKGETSFERNGVGSSDKTKEINECLFGKIMLQLVDNQAFSEFILQARARIKLSIHAQKSVVHGIDLDYLSSTYGLGDAVTKLVESVCEYYTEIELSNDLIDRGILYGFLLDELLFDSEEQRIKKIESAHNPKLSRNHSILTSLLKRGILLGIDFISAVFCVAEMTNFALVSVSSLMFLGLLGGEAMVLYSGVLTAVPKMAKNLLLDYGEKKVRQIFDKSEWARTLKIITEVFEKLVTDTKDLNQSILYSIGECAGAMDDPKKLQIHKEMLTQKIHNLFEADMTKLYEITREDIQKTRYHLCEEGDDWARVSIRAVNAVGEVDGFTILDEVTQPTSENC